MHRILMYLNSEFEWEVLLVRRETARCRPLKEGVEEEARHGRANLYPQKCNLGIQKAEKNRPYGKNRFLVIKGRI